MTPVSLILCDLDYEKEKGLKIDIIIIDFYKVCYNGPENKIWQTMKRIQIGKHVLK